MIKNRTTALLYPFYSNFGNDFINAFTLLSNRYDNVTLYLGDSNYKSYNNFEDYESFLDDEVIFAHVDKKVNNFDKYQMQLQSHKNYVTDYDNVFVFKLDEPYAKAARHLKKSEYSRMYSRNFIDLYFDESKFWYMKFKDENQSASFNVFQNAKMVTLDQHKEKWNGLNTEGFFNKIMLSPYHVLNRSENLRGILEIVYGTEIPENLELVEKIKLEKEILNYEKSKCHNIPCEEVF